MSSTLARSISHKKRNNFVKAVRRFPRVSVTASTVVSQSRAARARSAPLWPFPIRVANGMLVVKGLTLGLTHGCNDSLNGL